MNALLHEVVEHGRIDKDYVAAHTLRYDELVATVAAYPGRAAEIFGTSDRVLSTVLQGLYQSHQATSAPCQVNNLQLLRGMIDRPGCGLLQMNGQPTAENTRECGADGDLPGFLNWANPEHIDELARLWNVDSMVIPQCAPPTHATQLWRYAEQGSIDFLWISATNPAVSLPELSRIRDMLSRDDLFVVVQDGFLTETAQYAEVVLPAVLWGEKQGTFETGRSRRLRAAEPAVWVESSTQDAQRLGISFGERVRVESARGAVEA